jgi:hypothetical protein
MVGVSALLWTLPAAGCENLCSRVSLTIQQGLRNIALGIQNASIGYVDELRACCHKARLLQPVPTVLQTHCNTC